MGNFCTNCGAEIRKDYNFCTNCGSKIRSENNFCAKCGTEIRKDYNFCTNCGSKIDKPDLKQNDNIFNSVKDRIEKEREEEEKKKLKMVDEILESEEIKSEIMKKGIGQTDVSRIKNSLKYKLINKRENMNEGEIKYFIKTELKKAHNKQEKSRINKEKEMRSKKIEKNEKTYGGHCSLGCRHCYEEFFDSGGGIVGDFDSGGYTEYYCHLGHRISFGSFCEDYE